MIRVDVQSTFEPIIGSEVQSKELIDYIMKDYETNPQGIWKSEIFGRRVQEGIQSKISLMPDKIRFKLVTTLSKILNKVSNNLIAVAI